jgi:group I intron endonuclease
MPWIIYCHIHIDSKRRYIGLTSQTMEKRWKNHIHASKSSKGGRWHFPNAIRQYGKDAFSHEVLEVCETLEEANLAEAKWIDHFNSRDPRFGFNLSPGGSYVPHPFTNPWDRPEYRKKSLDATRKKSQNLNFRLNLSVASKKTWQDPIIRAKRLEASERVWDDPSLKEKMSIISTEINSRLGVKEKIGAAARGRIFSEETRKKISINRTGKKTSPEVAAKISASHIARGTNPRHSKRVSSVP